LPTWTADRARGDLTAARAAVDSELLSICNRYLPELPSEVGAAVRYSILGEGKRLRPILVLAAYRAGGGAGNATRLAASVEIVHAYSLVHDDLPCMDDDDVRRGRPTTHKVCGAPVATVAGVTMVPLAVRCAVEGARALGLPDDVASAIVRELMRAAGAGGMVAGQLLDLAAEGLDLSVEQLEGIHRAKTGALIAASARIGGLAAGVDAARARALDCYGESIGLAFQITDDVLDATSTTAQLGKTAGRDAALHKSTYPALLGVEGAKSRATALVDYARSALEHVGLLTSELDHLASYAVMRRS
jgi:geranylgeranyl pyrophosphate synthase